MRRVGGTGIVERTLQGIAIIPGWASKALSAREVELLEALKAKDPLRIANARRGIARIRSKVGLEGHADDRKRV